VPDKVEEICKRITRIDLKASMMVKYKWLVRHFSASQDAQAHRILLYCMEATAIPFGNYCRQKMHRDDLQKLEGINEAQASVRHFLHIPIPMNENYPRFNMLSSHSDETSDRE
jgi:hypothetical protein